MSIINDALKKTQQTRKLVKDKKASVAPAKPELKAPTSKQKSSESKRPNLTRAQFNFTWKMASLLTVTALLMMMLLSNQGRVLIWPRQYAANTVHVNDANANAHVAANTVQPAEKISFTFEGVFLSDNNKVALINKRPMQVGDLLNGMPIIQIDQDKVALQGPDGVVELKAGGTYLL